MATSHYLTKTVSLLAELCDSLSTVTRHVLTFNTNHYCKTATVMDSGENSKIDLSMFSFNSVKVVVIQETLFYRVFSHHKSTVLKIKVCLEFLSPTTSLPIKYKQKRIFCLSESVSKCDRLEALDVITRDVAVC